jgi:uncharacterized membrane protein
MSKPLSPGRLEAFSDGVIAVIITIMVLELHVPGREISNATALHQELPLLVVYLLSFMQIGIYWVNHHYLLDDLDSVSHGILWANLALLFSLSLIPWATEWLATRGISPFSVGLYSIAYAAPGLPWLLLSSLICQQSGKSSAGSLKSQALSFGLYVSAIPMAYVSPYISLSFIALVAVRWLLPPKKVVEQARSYKSGKHPHSDPS